MKHELSVHSDVNQHSHGLHSNEPLAIPWQTAPCSRQRKFGRREDEVVSREQSVRSYCSHRFPYESKLLVNAADGDLATCCYDTPAQHYASESGIHAMGSSLGSISDVNLPSCCAATPLLAEACTVTWPYLNQGCAGKHALRNIRRVT